MRLFLAYLHAKTHYFINNTLGIKHIIQFTLGVLAGGWALRAANNGNLIMMIMVLAGFSLLNQFFHGMFKQVHIANVVVKSEEAAEKTAQKLKERNIKVRKKEKKDGKKSKGKSQTTEQKKSTDKNNNEDDKADSN